MKVTRTSDQFGDLWSLERMAREDLRVIKDALHDRVMIGPRGVGPMWASEIERLKEIIEEISVGVESGEVAQ